MIRNGSPTERAGHQLGGAGGVPMANSEQANPPKWRRLSNTDHF